MLAGIMHLVTEGQNSRSRAQALADRAAFWLTFAALGVAIVTLIVWTIVQGFNDTTVERVVSTLVVACPHAVGLAIPLVIAITTTISARNGILVRDRLALEQARLLNTVVFDKTGTLTTGNQGVVAMQITPDMSEDEALTLAAAVERESEHPIAHAIVAAAQLRNLTIPHTTEFEALAGRGAQARVADQQLKVGGPGLLEQEGIQLPPTFVQQVQQWCTHGQTIVYL